ncbi:type III-A CRISPR-associated RAMP protein Csm4 [Caminibacter pacificus]
MKLYKTTLIPKSSFATPLKGDTIFGHLCWMILFEFGNDKLEELLEEYKNGNPFLVVSDGFAKNYLPKPALPLKYLNEEDKKEARKKKWLTFEDLTKGEYSKAKKDKDIEFKEEVYEVVKNSINYFTFTTDDSGKFAPYGVREVAINERDIYFLLDETKFTKKELLKILNLFEDFGYGKDISSGKGIFEFEKKNNEIELEEVDFSFESNTFMSLSPFVLDEEVEDIFYNTFVRFGKHGLNRVHTNAFKKPILMFDTASVVILKEKREFIGKAITDVSTSYKDTVHQGYSILVPIKDMK